MKSITPKVFVVPVMTAVVIMSLSIFTVTNSNVFAQQNNFIEELNLLNQTITTLENQDKKAKNTLFDVESLMEDKIKNNPEATNAEKRVEAALKMVSEENYQAALDHTKEAIKTLSTLNN
jgi:TolA-binding protein